MKQFIVLFLFLSPAFVVGQTQHDKLDSLHQVLKNASNDTLRMDAYTQLVYHYSGIDQDSALYYITLGIPIAQKLQLRLNEAAFLQMWGFLIAWTRYQQSFELLTSALKIAEDQNSEKNVWHLPPGQTPHIARLIELGWIHLALSHLHGNTGSVDKKRSSALLAMRFAELARDTILLKQSYYGLGESYYALNKMDSALIYQMEALGLVTKASTADDGWILYAIGLIHLKNGKFELAKANLRKGLNILDSYNSVAGIGDASLGLSELYHILEKSDSCRLYADKAVQALKKQGKTMGLAIAYNTLSSAYALQGNADSAFTYFKLSSRLRDSLYSIEKKDLLAYQNTGFDEQIKLKALEDEKIQIQTKIRTWAMLSGLAVFMLIALLLFRNNRHRKKANESLQKQKEEIAIQKENVEETLVKLKSTQAQLIHFEKMASLGELTAGIAHEIQNPMNFVNNFSDLNKELLLELVEEANKGNLAEVRALANDVVNNEEKINHHGKRAEAIVKGMLQHSRSSTVSKELTDVNALAGEFFRLAYHGIRAKDKTFSATMTTDFDPSLNVVNIIPQDIGRLILNLVNNAFYAVNEKRAARSAGNGDTLSAYEPTVSISTKKVNAGSDNHLIEIKISDNGNGIPQKVLDKIFQPFFTTKPTGQGTGLGLSLSYDIVKAHGGELKVETVEGKGSVFTIQLPAAI